MMGNEPSEDELARRSPGQRLGEREEGVEPALVLRGNENRALGRGQRGEVESGVLAQDRLPELLESRARLEPELVNEEPPGPAVGLEPLGPASRAVEGKLGLGMQALAETVPFDQRPKLGDELGVAAEGEVGLDPKLERGQAKFLEAGDRRACAKGS